MQLIFTAGESQHLDGGGALWYVEAHAGGGWNVVCRSRSTVYFFPAPQPSLEMALGLMYLFVDALHGAANALPIAGQHVVQHAMPRASSDDVVRFPRLA